MSFDKRLEQAWIDYRDIHMSLSKNAETNFKCGFRDGYNQGRRDEQESQAKLTDLDSAKTKLLYETGAQLTKERSRSAKLERELLDHEKGMRVCGVCGASGKDVTRLPYGYKCKCGCEWASQEQLLQQELDQERKRASALVEAYKKVKSDISKHWDSETNEEFCLLEIEASMDKALKAYGKDGES